MTDWTEETRKRLEEWRDKWSYGYISKPELTQLQHACAAALEEIDRRGEALDAALDVAKKQ
jgi:hypothetical protein